MGDRDAPGRDRDEAEAVPLLSSPAQIAATPAFGPSAGGTLAARVLALQATAGNRAVSAWLAREATRPAARAGSRSVAQQRRVLARDLGDDVKHLFGIDDKPHPGFVFVPVGSPKALLIPPDDDDCASRMIASATPPVQPAGLAPADPNGADTTPAVMSDVGNPLGILPASVPALLPGWGDPCLLDSPPPGAITDFEANIRDGKQKIGGVMLDPDSGEIIGYQLVPTTGLYRIVNREGELVEEQETGLDHPLLDPIDFIPTPGAVAKGASVIGKVGLKALGKFVFKEGADYAAKKGMQEVSQGGFQALKAASMAILGRAARAGAKDLPAIARKITEDGLAHSFDRHAAQWFGGVITRESHMAPWRALIERATRSSQIFPWSSGATKTIAHLATIDGKPFVVQFSRETGELLTAFVPTQRQLKQMFKLLALAK